ncbi:hypothetical protein FQA39_LY15446 [Lamprigera yunnana]|nr:hypothetical protein FQA39_LY15446 [Lamprigera yunnana]
MHPYRMIPIQEHMKDDFDKRTYDSEAEISQNQLPNEDDTTVQSTPDPQPPDHQPGCSRMSDIRKNTKGPKRTISSYDKRQEEAYNVLKELQAKKSRNRFTIFGKHVATKIEALKSSYAQNVVEHLI